MPGYFVDVLDTSLSPVGPGPLATVPRVRIVRRLDRAGQMTVTVPAVDPRAALIQPKRILSARTLRGGVLASVGSCIIDEITAAADAADAPMLDVSGPDLLGELNNRLVGSLTLSAALSGGSASNPATIGAALAAIMAFAPAGWTIDTTTYGPGTSTIYLELQNETVLAALTKVAAGVGEHFRPADSGRGIVWLFGAQPDSGVRAVMRGDGAALRANPHVCVVTSLTEQRDSGDAVTRIYPRGGGNEKAALTLQFATDTPPAGYSRGSDALGYFLKHDASDTANRIDGMVAFKEISVSASTKTAQAAAANTLQQATYQELAGHLPTAPALTYKIAVVGLDVAVRPGELLRLIYRKTIGSYQAVNVDAALVVLETTDELTANGARTIGMTVGTVGRWPKSDTEVLVSALNTVQNLDRHLQKVPEATQADTAQVIDASIPQTIAPALTAGGQVALDVNPTTAGGGTQYGVQVNGNGSGAATYVPIAIVPISLANIKAALWIANQAGLGGINIGFGAASVVPDRGMITFGDVGAGIGAPTSVLHAGGAIAAPYALKSADYTVLRTDSFIGVDATSANRIITLPTAVGCTGRRYIIKKLDASANTVTVATTSSQTIDVATTYVITARWSSVSVVSTGTNWLIENKF